ncbi:MAG TPA: flagellar motor switch protein FliN [Planctomycetota bacterium]|nr:flagellar motor switch protein FliN [Planctomycetota bacterium]
MPDVPASHRGAPPVPADALREVELQARLELGRALLPVRDLLQLEPGAVVELDRRVGDPVDLFVNDRLVARGEIVVAGGSFALRVTEVLSPDAPA